MKNISDQLTSIFKMVFDDESIELTPQTTANDIDGWDSLSHVNLILAIENEFNIEFDQREALGFKNVGELLTCIDTKVSTGKTN